MTPMSLGAGAIGIYLIAIAVVCWRASRLARDASMFNIFARSAKTIRATSGYLGLIGGGELIAITQLGYTNGWHALWLVSGVVVGTFVVAYIAPRLKAIADARGINTLSQFFADQHGAAAGYASTIIFLLSLGSLITIQFIVGSDLLASLIGIPRAASIAILGIVILSYLLPAGIVAVLSTDVLRAVMMSIVLVMIVGFAAFNSSSLGPDHQVAFDAIAFPENATYLALGLFGVIAGADVWQIAFASDNSRVIRRSLALGAVAFVAVGGLLAVLGQLTRVAYPVLPPEVAAFVVATTKVMPAALAPLAAILVTGSVMATADTEIWVIASLVANLLAGADGKSPRSAQPQRDQQLRRLTRWVMPFVTVVAMLNAYFAADAQAMYTGLLSLIGAGGPATLSAAFVRSPSSSVAWSLWLGLSAFGLLTLYFGLAMPLELALVPPAVAAVPPLWALVWKGIKRAGR